MTHDDIILIGKRWLSKQRYIAPNHFSGTKQIATEVTTISNEIADVIGWHEWGQVSTLIECKTSRSDFLADQKKPFRMRPDEGMGQYRFYLSPIGIIKERDLPDKWGLLETDGKAIYVVRASEVFTFNWKSERALLISLWRRAKEGK